MLHRSSIDRAGIGGSVWLLVCLNAACGRIDYTPLESGLGNTEAAVSRCPAAELDQGVFAHYRMDAIAAGLAEDSVGGRDGSPRGGFAGVPGHQGCGFAAENTAQGWIEVDDSPAWDLEVGSVDFLVRLPAPPSEEPSGLISRDAHGQGEPGHFTIFYMPSGALVARLQGLSDPEDSFLCTDGPLPSNRWLHIGFNFGPVPELYVEGTRASFGGDLLLFGRNACGQIGQVGIAGNDNPWAFAASTRFSSSTTTEPILGHLTGGAIDEIRISTEPRDFAQVAR